MRPPTWKWERTVDRKKRELQEWGSYTRKVGQALASGDQFAVERAANEARKGAEDDRREKYRTDLRARIGAKVANTRSGDDPDYVPRSQRKKAEPQWDADSSSYRIPGEDYASKAAEVRRGAVEEQGARGRGPAVYDQGPGGVSNKALISGRQFQEELGIGTGYLDWLEERGPVGRLAAAGIDTATAPATLATAFAGPAVGAGIRGATAGTRFALAGRAAANVVEPFTAGSLGKRLGTEIAAGTAGQFAGGEAMRALPEGTPGPVAAGVGIGAGILAGGASAHAVNGPDAYRAALREKVREGMTGLELDGAVPGQAGIRGPRITGSGDGPVSIRPEVEEALTAAGIPVNEDGTVMLYHGTTQAGAESIRKTKALRAEAEPDVYVSTDKAVPYGETVVPVRVKAADLELDDEFPGGRVDFRIRAGRSRQYRLSDRDDPIEYHGAGFDPRAVRETVEAAGPAVRKLGALARESLRPSGTPGVEGEFRGATTYAASLRPLEDVKSAVKTSDNPIVRALVGKTGINRSVLEDSDVGQYSIAFIRQRMAAEQLTETAVTAALDKHNPRGGFATAAGREGHIVQPSVFAFTDEGQIVNVGVKGSAPGLSTTWQDVFSRPDRYDMTPEQRAYVDDFNAVIADAEMLRAEAGMTPFPRNEDGSLYVPRQTKSIRGVELQRPSNSHLARHYELAQEGIDNGVRYDLDPRNTLSLHLRATYEEIAEKQLSDALEKYSVTASELVPAPVKQRMENAIDARQKVEREVRSSRVMAVKSREQAGKDIQKARLDLRDAERRLSVLRAEMRGREQLAAGRRQAPRSYGERLRAAQSEVAEARKTLDGLRAAATGMPRVTRQSGKGQAAVGEATQARLDTVLTEYNSAKAAYTKAMASARQKETANEAIFQPERLRMRDAANRVGELQRKANATKAGPEKDGLLAETADARVKLEEAKVEYAKARTATQGPTFGNSRVEVPIGQWRGRFFQGDDHERLVDALGQFGKGEKRDVSLPGKAFEKAGNVIRTSASVGDMAMPFMQGLPLLGRNPVAWAKMATRHYQAFFDPTVQARYVAENAAAIQEMARYYVPVTGDEFFKGLEDLRGLQKVAAKVPGGAPAAKAVRGTSRQTIGRFQAAYNTGLVVARAELWKSLAPSWKGSKDELATYVRNMTGGLDSRALGAGKEQRAWESTWLAFSPRLLRSTLALTASAAQPWTPAGRESFRTLAQLGGAVAAFYVLTGLAMGRDWEEIGTGLNPTRGKRFLSYEVNGDWVGVGGQVRAIGQLLGKLGADIGRVANGDMPKSFSTLDTYENPLIAFYMSRGAPGVNLALGSLEAASGGNWNTAKFDDIDSAPDLFKHVGTSALPFVVQGALEGQNAETVMASFLGARTSKGTANEGLDAIAQEKYGASFWDLRPSQKDAIKKAEPELWEQSVAKGSDKRQRAELLRIETSEKAANLDADLLAGKLTRRQWNTQKTKNRDELTGALREIYGGNPITEPRNAFEQWVQQIQQAEDPRTGVVNWEKVDDWEQRQPARVRKDIGEDSGLGATPLAKKRSAVVDEYYSLPKYKGLSSDQSREVDAVLAYVYQLAPSSGDERVDEVRRLRKLREYAAAEGVDAATVQLARRIILFGEKRFTDPARERWRKAHPAEYLLVNMDQNVKLTPEQQTAVKKLVRAA